MAKRREPLDPISVKETPTFVYVITSAKKVKIGIAGDVALRVRQLQNGAASRVELAHSRLFSTRLSAEEVERKLHRKFHARRTWGEWFLMDADKAVAALNAMKDPELHTDEWEPGMPPEIVHSDTFKRWKWCRDNDLVFKGGPLERRRPRVRSAPPDHPPH